MVDWKEPPPKRMRGRPWTFKPEFYEELKANPNEWALFREKTYASHAYRMRDRYPQLEVTLRNAGKSEKGSTLYDIYVRFVPDVESV
jgi:hypothetical protein